MSPLQYLSFDVAFAAMALLVLGAPAALLAWLVAAAAWPWWAWAGLWPLLGLAYLLGAIALGGLLRALLPALQPGRYPFPKHPQSRAWLLHFAVQRLFSWPPLAHPIWAFAGLRWAWLRAMGAQAPLAMNSAVQVQVIDPSLLELGPGCMLAAGTLITGHFVEGEELLLAPVKVQAGAQLHGQVTLSPGCVVGPDATIGPGSKLAPRVEVGEASVLGLGCLLMSDVKVGPNVVVGHLAVLEAGVVVGADAVVEAHARVPKGTVIEEGGRFPPRRPA